MRPRRQAHPSRSTARSYVHAHRINALGGPPTGAASTLQRPIRMAGREYDRRSHNRDQPNARACRPGLFRCASSSARPRRAHSLPGKHARHGRDTRPPHPRSSHPIGAPRLRLTPQPAVSMSWTNRGLGTRSDEPPGDPDPPSPTRRRDADERHSRDARPHGPDAGQRHPLGHSARREERHEARGRTGCPGRDSNSRSP